MLISITFNFKPVCDICLKLNAETGMVGKMVITAFLSSFVSDMTYIRIIVCFDWQGH